MWGNEQVCLYKCICFICAAQDMNNEKVVAERNIRTLRDQNNLLCVAETCLLQQHINLFIGFIWEGCLVSSATWKILCVHITEKCKDNRIFQELNCILEISKREIRSDSFCSLISHRSFLCLAVDHALENFYSISLHSCAALGMVHENGGIYIMWLWHLNSLSFLILRYF